MTAKHQQEEFIVRIKVGERFYFGEIREFIKNSVVGIYIPELEVTEDGALAQGTFLRLPYNEETHKYYTTHDGEHVECENLPQLWIGETIKRK